MNARFLITTANGRTGSAAARELLRLGHRVRCLVRRDDARAARWRELGAEVVIGNVHDYDSLMVAMHDVQRVYHCPPFDATHLHNSALVALAAQESGVEVVALMSGWNPHPRHPSIVQREHWITNNLYRRLDGFDVIHINPGMFAFTYLLGLGAAVHFGQLALPFGEGSTAAPANEDTGAVAAHALARPERWIGRCLRPLGPRRVSGHAAAAALARVLDRPVTYRAVSDTMFSKFARASGFPTFQIAQVVRYAAEMRAGVYAQEPNDHVAEVTGRPPESFEDTVRRYVASPELVWPGLSRGTWWSNAALGLRAALTPAPDLAAFEARQSYPLLQDPKLAHESQAWREAAGSGRLVLLPDPASTRSLRAI